jgi:hypothetical protein
VLLGRSIVGVILITALALIASAWLIGGIGTN